MARGYATPASPVPVCFASAGADYGLPVDRIEVDTN